MKTTTGSRDVAAKALSLGLIGTSPYYIADTALHTFTGSKSYVIYVQEDAILNVATIHNVIGNDIIGVILVKGYYHFACDAIQLDSGSAIVYLTA